MAEYIKLPNNHCDLKFHQQLANFKGVHKLTNGKQHFEIYIDKNNPAKVIPGYLEEKKKFEKRQEFANKLAELTEEEKTVYEAIKDHKYPKVEALLNA